MLSFALEVSTKFCLSKYFSLTPVIFTLGMSVAAVQNERQPRNTATIRPENLKEMDPESIIREASVAVGAFG